jgi:preprotein translocase subunit SecF
MAKLKKTKKVSRKRKTKSYSTGIKKNNTFLIGAGAALLIAIVVLAFPTENKKTEKSDTPNVPQQEVTEKKVSDIKVTKEVKPLNIPAKQKAINQTQFNEREVRIRFAEIDYNSNKKISINEYLYYFKDKAAGRKKFKSIDKNNDKAISYDEYLASKK